MMGREEVCGEAALVLSMTWQSCCASAGGPAWTVGGGEPKRKREL